MSAWANRVGAQLGFRSNFLLSAPFFVVVGLFWVVPLCYTLWTSLHYAPVYGSDRFVGLKQFERILSDETVWKAVSNTIVYSSIVTVFTLASGLLLVFVMLKVPPRMAKWIQISALVPGLSSPFGLSILYLLLFHGEHGLLNQLLIVPFGVEPLDWLREPKLIMVALLLQGIWRWTGFVSLFLAAALSTLPKEQWDAARLDGASDGQAFWYLGVPAMSTTGRYCAAYLLIDACVQFAGAYVLLGGSGGVEEASLMMVGLSYRFAFVQGDFGAASASGVIGAMLVAVLIGLLFLSFLVLGKLRAR